MSTPRHPNPPACAGKAGVNPNSRGGNTSLEKLEQCVARIERDIRQLLDAREDRILAEHRNGLIPTRPLTLNADTGE